MTTIADLPTPSLILDRGKLVRNIERLASRLRGTGVMLRPHLKTAKSIDVARLALQGGAGAATVSTLKEAQIFGQHGITDLLYAVQLSPQKLADVTFLRRQGVDLKVVVDSVAAADMVSAHAIATNDPMPCFIEIDVDGHRAGIRPDESQAIVDVGRAIARGAHLAGVMTHAGESYDLSTPQALARAAESERAGAVRAAEALRNAGLDCPIVSIGSTPTAHALENFEGVTEIRAGVYMFGDLVQVGIGVCAVEDIALSVLTTVIGHQKEKGWILVDCGWTAMSGDRGTASQEKDYQLGLVTDEAGVPMHEVVLLRAYQEHGIVALQPGGNATLPDLPVGARIRILPNHACATGAQHELYHVVQGKQVIAHWPRFNGWAIDTRAAPNLTIVSAAAVRATARRKDASDAVAAAFRAMSNDNATLFPVVNAVIEAPNTAFTIKSGVNREQGIVGVKIGSYWPRNSERFGLANHNSTTLLLDKDTGAPRALVNARELNGLRTAAANAVATS
ncbi:MAG TPA: alanine racemase, partial [Verrucomicrobiae bacterium]|nr:alanine racemase [Verrucomicrobiae bacterium]